LKGVAEIILAGKTWTSTSGSQTRKARFKTPDKEMSANAGCRPDAIHADLPVLAGCLVAIARGTGEAVEVALLDLSSTVKGSQGLLDTDETQSMRIPVFFGIPLTPRHMAFDALIFHVPCRPCL
jgi:hypothetical protein